MRRDHFRAILLQELFITMRSSEVIMDIFVFPVMSIIVFGFLAVFLTGSADSSTAYALLLAQLLWQVVFIVQYSVAVGSLWNIWARNLSNMFIAPISLFEYLGAQAFSGIIKALCIFLPASVLSIIIFGFNIYSLGAVNLFFFVINLMMFALAMGIVVLGLIFRFGTRIQAFAWGLLPIFQPLTAAFYPVSVLPRPLQYVAWMLSPTYVFESARFSLQYPGLVRWDLLGIALGVNLIYLTGAILFFRLMFHRSKVSGQFARLES